MKIQTITKLLLAAMGSAFVAGSAQAASFAYNNKDLLLLFRKSGHPDLEVNIGQVTSLTGLAPGVTVNVSGYSVAQLDNASGGYPYNDYNVAIVGGDTATTVLYVTKPRTSAGVETSAYLGKTPGTQNTILSNIRNIAGDGSITGAKLWSAGTPLDSVTNTASAVIIPTSALDSYTKVGGTVGKLGGTWAQGSVEVLTPDSFVTGSAYLDLYQVSPPNNTPATYLGFFAFNSDGTTTFTRAATVVGTAPTLPTLKTVGQALDIQLSAGASTGGIPNGAAVTNYNITTLPLHGSISGNPATGSFVYTPTVGFNGTESFTYVPIAGGVSGSPVVVTFTVSTVANIPAVFSSAVKYSTGDKPWSVAAGAFKGSSTHLDLAVGDNNTNKVSILLNKGTGAYTNGTTLTVGTTTTHVQAVATDGSILAVAADDDTVTVFTSNGDGTFGVTPDVVSLTPGSDPVSVAIGDVNGDTLPDLVVGDSTGNVAVILNSGGSFAGATPSYVSLVAGVSTVAFANMTGVNSRDVVVANETAGTVTVLKNISGTLTPQTPASAAHAIGLAIGDFNGDGNLDVATADQGANTVTVLLGNGAGALSAQTPIAAGSAPLALVSADFNQDSKADLAVVNSTSGSVDVLLGTGDGSFQYYTNLAKTHFLVGTSPVGIVSGNFDGNSNPDIAVTASADDKVSILLNAFAPQAFSQSFTNGENTKVEITLTGTGSSLTYGIVGVPAHGSLSSLSGASNNVTTYTPTQDYVGGDSFKFYVTDGNGKSATNTVSLVSTFVNQAPSYTALSTSSTSAENAGKVMLNIASSVIAGTQASEASQTLSWLVVNDNPALFKVAPAVATAGGIGTMTYTAATNANGVAHLTLQLKDSGGIANGGVDRTSATQFTITVTPVNNAPTVKKPTVPAGFENGSVVVPFVVTDLESNPDTFTYSMTSDDTTLFPGAANFLFGGSGNNRTVTLIPAANKYGTNMIHLTVTDGAVNTTVDLQAKVAFVNQAPSFSINPAYGSARSVSSSGGAVTLAGFATGASAGPNNALENAQTLSYVVSSTSTAAFSVAPAINATSGDLTFTPKPVTVVTPVVIFVKIKDSGSSTSPSVNLSLAKSYTLILNP